MSGIANIMLTLGQSVPKGVLSLISFSVSGLDNATVHIYRDGTIRSSFGAQSPVIQNFDTDWVFPKEDDGVDPELYEVRATSTGDPLDAGSSAEGVWMTIDQNFFWRLGPGGSDELNSTVTIEIREIADPANIVSNTFPLTRLEDPAP